MAERAVIFDLDGTLIDSLNDIANASNTVLHRLDLPTHSAADFRFLVGEGVAMLFRRALPTDRREASLVEQCVLLFKEEYDRTWNDQTQPYKEIPELLDALVDRRLPMAILSNKPDAFTKKCAEIILSPWSFHSVLGQRDGIPRKPDPAGALEIAQALNLPVDQILYVGDTATDMQTAQAAGMRAVGVTWGFRPIEELQAHGAQEIIHHPLQFLELLDDKT